MRQTPAAPTSPVLQLTGISKSFEGRPALRDVSLSVASGEVVALLGPNGAGKTTLLSIVAGLLRPDEGEVRVLGRIARPSDRWRKRVIGMAPQELGVYPLLTVEENLCLFGALAEVTRRALPARVVDVAETLQLDGLLTRRAGQLSGGEKRRVHTGAALLHSPPLLLLDEPTAGADVVTRAALLRTVRSLAAAGHAVVYSTHYLGEVEDLDARVVILDRGSVVADEQVSSLIATHGGNIVEFRLDGPVAAMDIGLPVDVDGSVLRVHGGDSAAVITQVIATTPAHRRIVGIRIIQPGLEQVFLAATGRTFEAVDPIGVDGSSSRLEEQAR